MDLSNDYPILILLLLIVALVLLVIRLAITFSTPPGVPAEIRGATLRIDGDRYGGPVPLTKLRLQDAREVNFGNEPSLKPRFQLNSTSVNSLRSGWFTLENGQRALICLMPHSRILYIPTTSDYVILVSVDNPERFLASLRTNAVACR